LSEINREIGARIKSVRTPNKLSAEEFAERISATPTQLAQYADGSIEIPVSLLHNISRHFDIGMAELLSGESAKPSIYSVARNGKGIGVSRRQSYDYQSLAYNFADRTIDPYFITIAPKPKGTEASLVFRAGQEFHYVLNVTVRVKIDKYEAVLNERDSICFDSTYPHSIEALDAQTAQINNHNNGKGLVYGNYPQVLQN